jgi:hypothetical protein
MKRPVSDGKGFGDPEDVLIFVEKVKVTVVNCPELLVPTNRVLNRSVGRQNKGVRKGPLAGHPEGPSPVNEIVFHESKGGVHAVI